MPQNQQLVALLESSLEATCLRAGANVSNIRTARLTQPHAVIGFAVDRGFDLTPLSGPTVRVEPGMGYILPEDMSFAVAPLSDTPGLYHWSHFRLKVLGELDLFSLIQSPLVLPHAEARRVRQINQGLAKTFSDNDSPVIQTVMRRRVLAVKMLELIVECCPPIPQALSMLDRMTRMLPVIRFMRDNMARPIFRNELAAQANLSPSRFHALFFEATGQSPFEYLTRLRLKRAQELLLSTAMQVQDIAQNVGFRDPFHFTRTFKRFAGQSPRQYRDSAQEQLRLSR
jgi:AraC-like DNA-binding protein